MTGVSGAAGRRGRPARGTDVVVGFAECHKRPHTEEMLGGLEILPRAERDYADQIGQIELVDLPAAAPVAPGGSITGQSRRMDTAHGR
jgi:two-component system sensor histidine kinase KdpD